MIDVGGITTQDGISVSLAFGYVEFHERGAACLEWMVDELGMDAQNPVALVDTRILFAQRGRRSDVKILH